VIEKDAVVRKMLAGMLTSEGYRVFEAETPQQARKLAREAERPVQLLITDLDNDGARLARELHGETPSLRLLSIGNQDIPAPVDWIDASHQSAMSKPFALSEVSRSVRALLDV
jgi:DNA-binding response OmpR family regulator